MVHLAGGARIQSYLYRGTHRVNAETYETSNGPNNSQEISVFCGMRKCVRTVFLCVAVQVVISMSSGATCVSFSAYKIAFPSSHDQMSIVMCKHFVKNKRFFTTE